MLVLWDVSYAFPNKFYNKQSVQTRQETTTKQLTFHNQARA